MKLIVVVVIILLIYFAYLCKTCENDCDRTIEQFTVKNAKSYTDYDNPHANFARRPPPLNQSLFDDSLFADVKTFNNDEEIYCVDKCSCGRLGIDKCLDYCDGKCVEFGITGKAFCFPS
jgi:hypothetical protein